MRVAKMTRWLPLVGVVLLMLAGCTAVATPEPTPEDEIQTHETGGMDADHESEADHDEEHADDHDEEHADDHDDEHGDDHESLALSLPALDAVELDGRALRVVATTSIIGDVVGRVGGDAIDLTVLMGPGQDPHSYEPGAQDLTAVANADVIFVNGWDLEESLIDNLATIGEDAPIVAVSAGIVPIERDEDDHEDAHEDETDADHDEHDEGEDHDAEHAHDHGSIDPHVWFDVRSVQVWADNIAQVLSDLDPASAADYASSAASYQEELVATHDDLEAQAQSLPQASRVLVTNHDAFRYFAQAYEFDIAGTVIPSASTLAEPSASDLAELTTVMQERGVCTVFAETTSSDQLAQALANELSDCENVQVLSLYTGALGSEGSGAETYIDMMRTNMETIVEGLSG